MRIAILGWGSLIWDARLLSINTTLFDNGWSSDGPDLPIEFSRVSTDKRLTLVIDPLVPNVRVLYAISLFDNIEQAIENLAKREGSNTSRIGYLIKNGESFPTDFKYNHNLLTWLETKIDIDAVIWTNLESNFQIKTRKNYSVENALEYIQLLNNESKKIAVEYIMNAPSQINTKFRIAFNQSNNKQ